MRTTLAVVLLCVNALAVAQPGSEKPAKINERMEQLGETLLARKSPGFMLPPSMNEQTRAEESSSVMRPYVALQFEYSLADVRWKGDDTAELPLGAMKDR